jgi:glycosyltransferase involved in cell wall biosynthesis
MNPSFANPVMTAAPALEKPAARLKILVVVEPGFAGAFGHVEGLVHYLVEQNQQVFLAYSSKRPGPKLPELIAYVKEHGGECLDLKVGNAPCAADIPALLSLRKFAEEIRPDVIHSHSSKAGILGRMQALFGIRARQFYTPHAYYGLGPRRGSMSFVYNTVEAIFGRIGRTIAVSEDEREFAIEALKIDPDRALLIPIAVDTDKFVPATAEEKKKARAELGLPHDGFVLGWMGRLSFQKDPQTLFRAFGKVDQGKTKCHLLQVGQGEEQESIDRLEKELGPGSHLTRLSALSNPRRFYHAIDGLILTSRYEACPTVAIEALSAGLPLVVSQAPGTNWLARCELSHFWNAPVEDAAGFAEAITQWLIDLPLRRTSNHRDLALRRFSIPHVYGTILEAYRQK